MVRLIDILVMAIYSPKRTELQVKHWGKPINLWEGETKAEQYLSHHMGEWVNGHYHALGNNGNHFFWYIINDIIHDISRLPPRADK